MAIHGYLRSAWLSHRALHIFIFRGILSPQTSKQKSRKLSTSDEGNAQHLVTLGGAMVVSMNKQNENTQQMGKKHAEAPEFWLHLCAMYSRFR